MRPRYGPWPPMNLSNGMRPPMRGRGGGPGGPPMRGMGPRPPPYPCMGPPMRHFGPPPPMGPRGPPNRGGGPMMPRMRPPPPHMLPPMMRPQRPMRPPMKKLTKAATNEGKIKKKKLKFRSFYVTRPWVNDDLRAEISKKDKLFDQAKSSNKADDWAAFKEQKDKCVHMYSALKLEFIGQHPEEVFSSEEEEDEDNEYLCEPCDRVFDEDSYREHLQEHQTCGIDGCQFNAHQLLVLAHIKMQHSSGLYDQIRNISTPEDIAKWREQRRKNYPSKANIERRYQQQAEMFKRGERIGPNKDRFGKSRNALAEKREKQRLAKKKKKRCVRKQKKKEEPTSLIDEKADWNGTMFPFRGTKPLDEEDTSDDQSHVSFSDDEWDCYDIGAETEEPVLNNALGALMGAYQSDSEEDVPKKKPKTNENNVQHNLKTPHEATDNEADVIEIPIQKTPVDLPDKATELRLLDRKRAVPVTATSDDVPIPPRANRPRRKPTPPEKFRQPRRPTLLQKLLDREIRHERNVILQCVRFVVNNNFFIKPDKSNEILENADLNDETVDRNTHSSLCNDHVNEGASTSQC